MTVKSPFNITDTNTLIQIYTHTSLFSIGDVRSPFKWIMFYVLSRYNPNTLHLHGAQHSWIMMCDYWQYMSSWSIFLVHTHTSHKSKASYAHQALMVNSTENCVDRTLSLSWMNWCVFFLHLCSPSSHFHSIDIETQRTLVYCLSLVENIKCL